MRLLLVEDDAMLADAMSRALAQSAHVVDKARSGEDADLALLANEYDLVVLDIGLPRIDGFEVLKRLRSRRCAVPVLILTVRDGLEDRVTGLDLGADDYLTKPFHLSELEARVRALIRRANANPSPDLIHGRLRLNMGGRRLFCDEKPLDLSAREFAVLELLMLREGRVVTKQQVIDKLCGRADASSSNAVEVLIHRLRKKLECSGMDIRTLRGMGYLIERQHAA